MAIAAYTFDAQKTTAYADLCFELYRGDPNWIPPLRKRIIGQFSEQFFFYHHKGNSHCHFLATAGGKAVGHISAMINAQLGDPDDRPVGVLGFFECKEDRVIASDLLGHAVDWLRSHRSADRIWSPIQFDIWNGYRFMTRGFDRPAFFGEPYNKPWYPGFFVENGFAVRKRWYSVEIRGRPSLQRIADLLAKAREIAIADGYRFAPFDLRDPDTVRSLRIAVEASYHKFLGVSPLDAEEFHEIFLRYAEALDSRFAIGAFGPDRSLSGFAIAYPDYRQGLRAMRGANSIMAKMRFYLGSRRIDRAVFFMIGITPKEEWRGRGLGRALFCHCLTTMIEAGYQTVVFALLAEDSPAWRLIAVPRDEAQKEYALYEATFTQ